MIKNPGYFFVKERSISNRIDLKSKMERWNTFIAPTLHSFFYLYKTSILFYNNEVAGIRAPVAIKE